MPSFQIGTLLQEASALIVASKGGSVDIIKLLLSAGADTSVVASKVCLSCQGCQLHL